MGKSKGEQHMRLKVLMVQLNASTFVLRDEEMLSSFADLKVFRFRHQRGWRIVAELIRQKLFLLRHIWQCQLIYVWFADFHAALPALFARLTGRKCVVVIGGVDAAYLPEYQYGTKTRILGRISLRLTVRLAHLLLPVSQFTLSDLMRNVSAGVAKKSVVVHNCYTPANIAEGSDQGRKLILCVAMASAEKTIYIKGVDLFLQAAALLPDKQFMLVGPGGNAMELAKRLAPDNVELSGPVPFGRLQELYRQTRVVCQFSRQESFGIALLEGLAAGCVPAIANCCGPAEVFRDTAVPAIDAFTPEKAAEAIMAAYKLENTKLEEIRQKVLPRFDCALRRERLKTILEQL